MANNNKGNYTNLKNGNGNNTLNSDSTDYDYSRITIYPSNYVGSNSVNLNYAIPTLNVKITTNNNNINNSYKATKLYVNGDTVHNYDFDDVDYIKGDVAGEIILEHTPYNGSGNKLFVIIPVIKVNKPNEYNALNSLLNMMSITGDKSPIEFNLNTNLKSDTGYYYYTHSSNDFIVFKQAIEVGANSTIDPNQNVPSEIGDTNGTGTINSVSSQNSSAISIYESSSNAKKTDRGTVNSLSAKEDQIYIDCQPTGYSEETISTYNLPINSEYTENAANVNLQRTTTSLVVVMVGMLLCYFVGPNVYKTAIIDQFIKNVMYNQNARNNCMNPLPSSKPEACTNASENERILGGIDSLLLISVFWIFLSLLSVGASYKNSYSTISIYFLFGIISTFFGIQHSRSKKEYMTGKLSDGTRDFTLYEWYFDENWNMDKQYDYNFMGYSVTSIFEALAKLIRKDDKTSISFHILLFAGVILVSSLISSGFFELGNPASSKLWGSILIPMFIILYIPFNMSTSGSSIGKGSRIILNKFWFTDTS